MKTSKSKHAWTNMFKAKRAVHIAKLLPLVHLEVTTRTVPTLFEVIVNHQGAVLEFMTMETVSQAMQGKTLMFYQHRETNSIDGFSVLIDNPLAVVQESSVGKSELIEALLFQVKLASTAYPDHMLVLAGCPEGNNIIKTRTIHRLTDASDAVYSMANYLVRNTAPFETID